MPEIVYGVDPRFLACEAIVSARSDTRLILTNPGRKSLVTVAIAGTAPNVVNAQIAFQAESAALSTGPYAACSNDTYVYALGVNTLFRAANGSGLDTAGYAVTAYVITCADPRWLCVNNGFVYAPYEAGGVAVYTAAGVLMQKLDHVLANSTYAAVDDINGLLYVADGANARAVALTIAANGTLAANPEFALMSCKNIVGLVPDADYLAIACEHRLVLFATTVDPTAPTHFSTHRIPETIRHIARVGANAWWLASVEYLEDQADRFNYRNYRAAFLGTKGLFVLSALSARVIGVADFTAFRPGGDGGDGGGDPDETFYILQEDGFIVLAENSDLLRQE